MKKSIKVAGLVIAGLLQGCTSYTHTTILRPSMPLDKNKGVVISIPANGCFGPTEYPNSGRMTANEVQSAFIPYASHVDIAKDNKPDANVYYVKPSILHWEDRATEWSGLPDRIEVTVEVYESGSRVAASKFSGKSKWFTFGGDHPQDLLKQPLAELVKSLYEHNASLE